MSLNMNTFKPSSPNVVGGLGVNSNPTKNDSRAALGNSDHLRMETFKANGNSWSKQLGEQLDTGAAMKESEHANSAEGIVDNTIKGIPQAAYNMGKDTLKGFGKFVKSAVSAPYTLFTGGKTAEGTFERDAQNIAGDVVEGKAPLSSALAPIAGTIGEGTNILTAGELGPTALSLGEKALGATTEALAGTGKAVAETAKSLIGKGEMTAKDVLQLVSPKQTAKQTAEAIAERGGKAGGLFTKGVANVEKRVSQVADAVKGIVKKGVSNIENVNNVREALGTEAENLKSQIKSADHAFSYKELSSRLSKIKEPISIKGTAFEKQIGAVKDAAMDIVKKNGGKISSLLDSRKELDALVSKEYPNLYDKESAPMRNAITSIRNEINNFIEDNLPKGVSYKDSLSKQSLFYDAIDNISEKAAEETKTTGLDRLAKAHPTLVKGAKTAATLAGGGAIVEGVDALRGK